MGTTSGRVGDGEGRGYWGTDVKGVEYFREGETERTGLGTRPKESTLDHRPGLSVKLEIKFFVILLLSPCPLPPLPLITREVNLVLTNVKKKKKKKKKLYRKRSRGIPSRRTEKLGRQATKIGVVGTEERVRRDDGE